MELEELEELVINHALQKQMSDDDETSLNKTLKRDKKGNGTLHRIKKPEIKINGKPYYKETCLDNSHITIGNNLFSKETCLDNSHITIGKNLFSKETCIEKSPTRNVNDILHRKEVRIQYSSPNQNATNKFNSKIEDPKTISKLNTKEASRFASTIDELSRSILKPKETNLPVKAEIDFAPPSMLIVPEGYGCKCPKTVRRITQFVKVMLLLLYISGMPIILYHLHNKLQHTKRRLRMLEEEVIHHVKYNPRVVVSIIKKYDGASTPKRFAAKEEREKYEEPSLLKKHTASTINNIQKTIAKYEER